ncbi:zinc finger protein 562-like [Mytilus californianus]|uniref:zinc finger protein 562-like n=1 Tax=Mytilus californianus TaxID=6549 RepID=UPI002246494E|nr:zinc finger protein 562-like [Mytilus californianus]
MADIFLKEDRYGEKLLNTLDTLRKERKWIDFYIETKTGLVPVHRIVLAASEICHLQSQVYLCQDVNTLDLTDFNKNIVEIFISYLYTGEIKLVGESNIRDFINLCKKLDFKTVLLHEKFHHYNRIKSKLDGSKSELLNQCTSETCTLRAKSKDKEKVTRPPKVTSQLDENFTCLSEESINALNPHTVFMTTTVNGQIFVKTDSNISCISTNHSDINVSSKSVSEETFDHFKSHESTQKADFSEDLEIKQEPKTYDGPDIEMSESTQNEDLPIFYEIKIEPNGEEESDIEMPEFANIQNTHFSRENKVQNSQKSLLSNKKSTLKQEEQTNRTKTSPDTRKFMSKDVEMDHEETSVDFKIKGTELGEACGNCDNQQMEMGGNQDDMAIKKEQENLDSNIIRTLVKTTQSRLRKDNIRPRYLCHHCNYITHDKSDYSKHTSQHTDKTYMYIVPRKSTDLKKAPGIKRPTINQSIKKSPTKVESLAKNSSDQVFSFLKTLPMLPANQPSWQISCEECGKTFRSKFGHTLHIKNKHNMDYKHLCSVCGKGFNQAIQYRHHCRRHQHQIKVDTCPLCKTEFIGLGSLKRHLETCNKSSSYPHLCDICGSGFSTKGKLQEHYKGKHEEPRYSCWICYKRFNWRSSLKAHFRCKHKGFDLHTEPA